MHLQTNRIQRRPHQSRLHKGNTSPSHDQPAELIQLLAPNGQERYESGDQMLIQWHQNGAFSKPVDQAYQLTTANQLPVSYWRLGGKLGRLGRRLRPALARAPYVG